MPIEISKDGATFRGVCIVEEAEEFFQWAAENPGGVVSLKECEHLHTSLLQVLMATKPDILDYPEDNHFAAIIRDALASKANGG